VADGSQYGIGMSQEDFMLKDECLLVNYNDEVIGAENKYNLHKFVEGQPKGIVHRAFSVMLFDSEGRMLLQQRAATKVTFPRVWTNACCSHPLYGQAASEVDAGGSNITVEPVGVARAAVRKLQHELGIKPGVLSPEKFKFMGRVHYWAADTVTWGAGAPWGEHEIDYLLIAQLDVGQVLELEPHQDEVMATQWVSAEQLQMQLADAAFLWSPWFRVIARECLFPWWADLKRAFQQPAYPQILRFDAPPEHRKSGGCHDGAAASELVDLAAQESGLVWASDERRELCLRKEREVRRAKMASMAAR